MELYKKLNNVTGWVMFLIAGIVYTLTLEPTASFWDCGEFISSAYKLEVGHPPGNPIFMLTGRFFANFVSDPTQVAWCINFMSAMFSAATILLLFWTITAIARKIVIKNNEYSLSKTIAIMGSGAVGALAYTFSDTFWFSAVEGEVYAYSSFCTALVVWLILKWENHADEPHANRYIILIAYIIGISIAVHLLNLLCIPAIVLIYYYKKWKNPSAKGSILALLASFALIFFILYGLVPGFIKVAGWMELLFVNNFGVPYNTGAVVYFFMVIGCICWGIYETFKQKSIKRLKLSFIISLIMVGLPFVSESIFISLLIIAGFVALVFIPKRVNIRLLNTILTCIMVIFIGYSSYAIILLRSTANTPMDQNSPEDVFALSSYLNREQYGERPLLYGQSFTSEIKIKNNKYEFEKGKAIWKRVIKNNENEPDKYIISDYEKDYIYKKNMYFPRMYSNQPHHIEAYKEWSGASDKKNVNPSFSENLKFFFSYQVNHMYWRYFMWNFVGRQNDIQGHGELHKGNWITGFDFIDKHIEGENLPSDLKNNKGRNVYYMLPLLLGLIGLFYQSFSGQKGIESFWVTFFLFFMTGLSIVIYLNQTPYQPRERDYAYAGSFYAFTIWIGMGVLGVYSLAKKYLLKNRENWKVALVCSIVCLLIPVQMASQNWDDHDRSGRYVARDFAKNYLNCVEENGIIFTNGDNDTFPLWYVQETEGYRTDVRVCNLSYLQTDWYVDQMKSQSYQSAPLPIDFDRKRYGNDGMPYALVYDTGMVPDEELDKTLEILKNKKNKKSILEYGNNEEEEIDIIPNSNLYINVDTNKVLQSGIIPNNLREYVTDKVYIPLQNGAGIGLNQLSVLSMINSIAKDDWKRPIYYAITVGSYLYLDPHFANVGLAYRILPISNNSDEIAVDTEKMYDNMMNKFEWGGVDNPDVYLDETCRNMVKTIRYSFMNLIQNLIIEKKFDKALKALDRVTEKIPSSAVKYDYYSIFIPRAYYMLGEEDKGKKLLTEIADNSMEYVKWFKSLDRDALRSVENEYNLHLATLREVIEIFAYNNDEDSAYKYLNSLDKLGYNLFKE